MESGALNKKFLLRHFRRIVSNLHLPSVDDWNWEIGEHLTKKHSRDMSDPARFDQPPYGRLVPASSETEDHGGVRINSGTHDKAAFNVPDPPSEYDNKLFPPRTSLGLYYLSLLAHLSPNLDIQRQSRRTDPRGAKHFRSGPEQAGEDGHQGVPRRRHRLAPAGAAFRHHHADIGGLTSARLHR